MATAFLCPVCKRAFDVPGVCSDCYFSWYLGEDKGRLLTREDMAERYPEAMWSNTCAFTRDGERLYAFVYAGLWAVVHF